MSFYINYSNNNRPGPISSNALNNVCEKVLIEVNKVFDACLNQQTNATADITIGNFTPANPTFPLTFVSASSDSLQPATITDVVIERLETKPNFANVTATISVPIVVAYVDANGISGSGTSTLTVTRSAVMFVPQSAIITTTIKAVVAVSGTIGTFTSDTNLNLTYCIQSILKVIAPVDILVPSFGYPVLPECQETTPNNSACPGFFTIPVYPTAR